MQFQDVVQVSPSQLEHFQKCPRAWYLERVEGRYEVEDEAPEYRKQGKRVHQVIEWYLLHGRIPTPTEFELVHGPGSWVPEHHAKGVNLVKKALENGHLPRVSADVQELEEAAGKDHADLVLHPSELLVEAKIEEPIILNPDGSTAAWLLGYADLIWEDPRSGVMNVDDHKTTSDLDRAKTPSQLLEDIQLNAYAEHVYRAAGSRDVPIRLRHVYYETKNKIKVATMEVVAHTDPEKVAAVWEGKVVPITSQIVQLRRDKPPALEVEGRGALNGHCNAYGGCRHREFCGINKTSSFAQFGGAKMSDPKNNPLMARLMAAGKTPTTPPPAGEPAPAAAPAPATGMLARLAAAGQGAPALGVPAAAAVSAERGETPHGGGTAGHGPLGKTTAMTVADIAILEAQTAGLLPPDAPPRTDPAPEPAPVLAEEPMPAPAPRARARRETIAAHCPACRKGVKLDKDGRIPDHLGVDASLVPDKSAPCVTSGDTMEEAAAWMAKKFSRDTAPEPRRDREAEEDSRVAELEAAVAAAADRIEQLQELVQRSGELEHAVEEQQTAIANRDARIQELEGQLAEAVKMLATAAKGAPAEDGMILYWDTFPIRGAASGVTLFDTWIAPVIEEATKRTELPDYQLLDYKSGSVLILTLREHVAKNGLPKHLAVSTKHRAWAAAQEVLVPLAKKIIKPSY